MRVLGGPACSYVGHPLIERASWIDGLDTEVLRSRLGLRSGLPILVVLPGSRPSEVSRLMAPFGETIGALHQKSGPFEIIIPAVPSVRPLIEQALQGWPQQPHLVEGESDKFTAFKLAHAALAASGTVTLELGVAGTPMVVAYRVDPVAARLRFLAEGPFRRAGKPCARRKRIPGIHPGGLHARETQRRPCSSSDRHFRAGCPSRGARNNPSEDVPAGRNAERQGG